MKPAIDRLATFEATDAQISNLRRLVAVVLVLSLLAMIVRGADSPADPYLLPKGVTTYPTPGAASRGRTPLAGFAEVPVTIRSTPTTLLEWCLLLAATEAQHAKGLMGVTDKTLGRHDGMLFVFDALQDHRIRYFYMLNTKMPLSVAFFDDKGAFVSAADMLPCAAEANCKRYYAAADYRYALEVPQGGLARLGIRSGATLARKSGTCAPLKA